jgi:8-oxo-dGTP diphosphatase
MIEKPDIHKAAGIIIVDRKLLVERSVGKEFFIAPGGSIEKGETAKQALVRELKEEFDIDVKEAELEEFGTFYDRAAGQEHLTFREDVFWVRKWEGEPTPSSEVEEIAWLTTKIPEGMKIGSTFQFQVMPRLKAQDFID